MHEPPRSERIRYRVDNFLARGSGSLFAALVIAFVSAIVLITMVRGVLHLFLPDEAHPFVSQIWMVFLEITDPGNMSQDSGTPTLYKIPAMLAGFSGVVIFSAVIAFLTTALDQAIGDLKKGRSRVLESGHTLVLGWGPRVFEILRELIVANESEDDAVVVVLSEQPKEDMDDELRARLPDRKTTRIVTRHGSPASVASLALVAAEQAESAIVLADCSASASSSDRLASDAKVIKTTLALAAHTGPNAPRLVAELFDPRNRELAEEIAPGRVSVVDTETMLAKIMVQTSRTSGLAVVYSEALSFVGCEIYFFGAKWGDVTFGQCQFHFKDGVPIGVARASGEIVLRPEPGTPMEDGDEVIIVANDDSSLAYSKKAVADPGMLIASDRRGKPRKERMLILGWSPKAPVIIQEYADYVLEGSTVDVLLPVSSPAIDAEIGRLSAALRDIEVTAHALRPLVVEELESVNPFAYDHIFVLRQDPDVDTAPERVDAESILVLLQLRKIARRFEKRGVQPVTRIITEVLDSENQELVNQAGVNDFLISNSLVSMVFAQISQEPRILQVYEDLFREEGSEIYVKAIELYLDELPVTCTFADLMGLAQRRNGEICIGVKKKLLEHDAKRNYGITLVPPKRRKYTLEPGDALVVVADDEF